MFLDIDGVLCIMGATDWDKASVLEPECCRHLKTILDFVGAFLVLSSSWRLYDWAIKNLRDTLRQFGVFSYRIIGQAPDLRGAVRFSTYAELRWLEIKQYIDKNQVKDYLIIDDLDLSAYEKKRFIKTETRIGLTEQKASECIKILKDG